LPLPKVATTVIGMAAIDPENLRLLMDRSGMTAVALAVTLEISPSYVSRILGGERRLERNPVLRRRIADALKVPQSMIEARDEVAA